MTQHVKEAVTNRLLRRVDWRFLLPNPQPRRSVCFGDGLLADAVALISGQMVDSADAAHAECELSVAVNPDQATLRRACAALRSGGACYTEWYRPWSGGAVGVRRRLEAAGFTDVICYWPWPWPTRANPQFWLPLEAPNALAFFLANRPPAQAKHRQLLGALYRRLWCLALRTHAAVPICAIARKPASSPTASACAGPEGILATVRAEWNNWEAGNMPGAASCVLLTGGLRSINKVVGLVFVDPKREPALVVKAPRVVESIPALEREVATLRAVQAIKPGGMAGVPTVLFCEKKEDLLMVGESVVSGVPLWTRLRPDNYRSLALQATAWVAELAGSSPQQPPTAWWNRLVEPVLAAFQANFGPILATERLHQTRTMLATLGDLPLVCEHRDFSPWNVLLTPDGQLGVLDWESAQWQGLPGLDLVYFLTYLTFFRDGAMASQRFLPAYRTMLDETTVTGRVFHECMTTYARQLGLELASLKPLRVLTWLVHARSEYQRLVADEMNRPTPAALRSSLFFTLWEEELCDVKSV